MVRLLFAFLLFGSMQKGPAAVDQAAPSKFDVVSIHPVKTEPGHFYGQQDGWFLPSNSSHLRMTSWSVVMLLRTAFSLAIYQVDGYDKLSGLQPSYAIQARGDEDVDKKLAELPTDQCRDEQLRMLQSLLVDRFQLKFHWEDRTVPGYRLVMAERGPKLLPVGSLPIDEATRKMRGGDGKMLAMHASRDELGNRVYVGRGAGIADLVRVISAFMNSPIQDATRLDGKYDFDLRIVNGTTDSNPREDPKDQAIDALQNQLGLRLEATPTKQKVLVIDHIEAPKPN